MATTIEALVRIDANLQWSYVIGKGGNYVAKCDPLKLTLQAHTWAELMEDTADVLNSIFRDLLKSNELHRFLHDHGWGLVGPIPAAPQNVRFDVPFFFHPSMGQPNGAERYVSQ